MTGVHNINPEFTNPLLRGARVRTANKPYSTTISTVSTLSSQVNLPWYFPFPA